MMRPRQINLRHVARRTILRGYAALLRAWLSAGMASLTFRVVVKTNSINFLVWIVTGRALDSLVGHVVAPAVGEPVRLKADVQHAMRAARRDLVPGAMALPAELRRVLRRELAQFLHRGWRRAPLREAFHVCRAVTVATLALHPRNQRR